MAARKKGSGWMADFMVAGVRYREFGFASEGEATTWELDARRALASGAPVSVPDHVAKAAPEASLSALVDHCRKVHWASKKAATTLTRNAELFAAFVGADSPARTS